MKYLESILSNQGLQLSEVQKKQFDLYFQKLVKWNQKVNLTAITEEKEVTVKHFYDSLTPAFYFPFSSGMTLCDVGSGAGFPGIPLKIMYPGLKLTLVDALKKRLSFIESLTGTLNLNDVRLYHDRAETFAHRRGIRESFDIVTARAVAPLSVLCEYCLPLNRTGGTFIALKGANASQEISCSDHALHELGGTLQRSISLDLPDLAGKRTLVFIKKTGTTPVKYPRKPGTPSRKPL